jgi:flavin reductase (DIM6/NTAB) family NADH-FMN oxidoreductase RutF
MKKNIGAVNALYPMPTVIVGTEIEGKANYSAIAHVGIIDHNTISISMNKAHYSNQGIKQHRTLSISIPTEKMIVETDYMGLVSGANSDKSMIYESFAGELKGAPMIKEAPLTMECKVIEIIDRPHHDVFLVEPQNTYCNENILTDDKIDISKIKPILFDMPLRKYWKLGETFADCWSIGKNYNKLQS